MLITVIQRVIEIVGHRGHNGHHGHHVREQASAELEDRESLAVAAASVQDQDNEEGETFIERFDHYDDGLDNQRCDHYDDGLDNQRFDHHDDGLDNQRCDHHDDGLDNHFAIDDDHCRYSKGVSAVETILLVDRLRQQAFSHTFSPSFIFYHYHHQQDHHHSHWSTRSSQPDLNRQVAVKEKLASCSKREAMRKTMSMPNFVQVYDDEDDDDADADE